MGRPIDQHLRHRRLLDTGTKLTARLGAVTSYDPNSRYQVQQIGRASCRERV